jgi:hypothetical protein
MSLRFIGAAALRQKRRLPACADGLRCGDQTQSEDAEALNNRCWVRAMVGDLHAALRIVTIAAVRPDFVDSLDSRGFVKLKIGQPQRAIADYDAALQLSARKASSLYGRGIAEVADRRRQRSQRYRGRQGDRPTHRRRVRSLRRTLKEAAADRRPWEVLRCSGSMK